MLNAVIDTKSGAGPGDPAAEYLVLAATASLSAERVLTLGTGLTSSDGGAGASFTITSDPKTFVYLVTASHPADSSLLVPDVDFSINSRNFHKNQIFLNGTLLTSGSSLDYFIDSPATGSITFKMNLKDDDVVTIRQT